MSWIFTDPEFEGEAVVGSAVGLEATSNKAKNASADVGAEVGLSAIGIKQFTETGVPKKTFYFKVYDEEDNFIGLYNDVINEPSWTQEINSPGSVVTLELARNSDSVDTELTTILDSDGEPIQDSDGGNILGRVESRSKIGPGSTVNHDYRVEIIVFYGSQGPILDSNNQPILDSDGGFILGTVGAPNGRRIFNGFISEISSRYGGSETTLVEVTSYGWDLDQYVIQTEGGDSRVPFNSFDPSDIVRDAIADFTDRSGSPITISPGIEDTNEVVSYTFNTNTYLEVLEKAIELAPEDWYFFVDLGTNEVVFAEKPADATHTFLLGEQIAQLDLKSYILNSTNDVWFTGAEDEDGVNLFRRATEAPANGTRRTLRRITDQRVSLTSTADTISNTIIARNNKIQYRTTVDILDAVYDIETIRVGDTVQFRNFDNYVDNIEPLQVIAMTYQPDRVTLQLDTLALDVNRRIEDLSRNQNTSDFTGNPDAPTT